LGNVAAAVAGTDYAAAGQPRFLVYLSANSTIASLTNTKISWDLVGVDNTGSFSNGKFIAPTAGQYQLNCTLFTFSNIASGTRLILYIYKNGSDLTTLSDTTLAASIGLYNPVTLAGAFMVTAAAGDYFEVYAVNSSGAALPIYGGTAWVGATFSGFRIP
jgi:hypothetical protein